jgi:hypothetical protein
MAWPAAIITTPLRVKAITVKLFMPCYLIRFLDATAAHDFEERRVAVRNGPQGCYVLNMRGLAFPALLENARMKSSAMRAATSAPPAPYNAAIRLDERSGVKACRPSSNDPKAMRAAPTTNGRGQARQTNAVIAKYPAKWSNSQPRPLRGCHFSGPRAMNTSRIRTATLKNFKKARIRSPQALDSAKHLALVSRAS